MADPTIDPKPVLGGQHVPGAVVSTAPTSADAVAEAPAPHLEITDVRISKDPASGKGRVVRLKELNALEGELFRDRLARMGYQADSMLANASAGNAMMLLTIQSIGLLDAETGQIAWQPFKVPQTRQELQALQATLKERDINAITVIYNKLNGQGSGEQF